ncbi:MAG TPA: YceD family protein, partial [Rubrivivax sp.]|nr:YceD family protein [Rubrivivax sp.]
MNARDFDVRRLDAQAFAKAAAQREGAWPLQGFDRLRDLLAPTADGNAGNAPSSDVHWSLRGEERPVRAAPPEIWLHLGAQAVLPLVCQRCLQPLLQPLALQRHYQLVRGEEAAAALDGEVDHEVLALTRELDVHDLLEDELLLDLPLVPRHAVCPQPLPL